MSWEQWQTLKFVGFLLVFLFWLVAFSWCNYQLGYYRGRRDELLNRRDR